MNVKRANNKMTYIVAENNSNFITFVSKDNLDNNGRQGNAT